MQTGRLVAGQLDPSLQLETMQLETMQLESVLLQWVNIGEISPTAKHWLVADLLTHRSCLEALGIAAANAPDVVEQQLQQLLQVWSKVQSFCWQQLQWQTCPMATLWRLWLPLANWIQQRWQQHPPLFVQGILGGQGTGKSTLAALLAVILSQWGLRVCRLSIDDLYLTYAERLQLQAQDPRLKWRGPPGTHDIQLGLHVLQQLRSPNPNQPIQIPRFDKSLHHGAGDRTQSEVISAADIVLFEGWFVGLKPIDPQRFENAPPPILTERDRQFAKDNNDRLAAYLPLWEQLDSLIVLQPQDYRLSQQWRRQAEQQMTASGRSGMQDAEIDEFVEYFWRSLHPELFIPALLQQPGAVDLVIEVQPDHTPGRVYRPQT